LYFKKNAYTIKKERSLLFSPEAPDMIFWLKMIKKYIYKKLNDTFSFHAD